MQRIPGLVGFESERPFLFDLFDDLDGLFAESVAFIRREWAAAGERLA